MRIVLQRVTRAHVEVNQQIVGEIADGFVLLVGITHGDTKADADKLLNKIAKLRLFSEAGSDTFMEQNIVEYGGALLVVSQFTLYGDTKKGTRPSFTEAAKPEEAQKLYAYFVNQCIASGIPTQTGEFGAEMEVQLTNDGPITLILES